MNTISDVAGLAALSICESILLSLTDLDIIEQGEAVCILEDAAAAHRGAIAEAKNPEAHEAAAVVIDRIIKGKNSVPRDNG
ncbi:hypothetical protein HQ394_18165 [Defluviicoccus vanus]|uniref:Uncharacterized protein n=2 Tax=Defluviicoccus vanus TaxID=111831 RepID=A0A7H1N6T6_9PROT|nr:hypothetical protein HQ394_18165 [Defluviicoccus vanus]